MKHRFAAATALTLASLGAQAMHGAEDGGLPVKDGRPVVATVNDGAIALDEFLMQIDFPVDRARLLGGVATTDELAVLDRLIASRLIAQEASTMGIGDLPEIRKQVDVYSREAMRGVLLDGVVKDIKPDEAAVEVEFKGLVAEWKTASLLFQDEAAAKSVQEKIASGADYDTVAARAVADKSAKPQKDDAYHPRKEFLPEIAAALAALEVGQVSPVIRIGAGFVVLRVVDIRYPENEAARAQARGAVLQRQQQEAIGSYEQALRAERVVVHADVLDGLDYTTTAIDTALKDTRVLAEIKGANPVTVADLTDYMRMQAFHGGDQAAQGKRLNARKTAALEATTGRRLLNAEALRLKIDETDSYLDRVNAFEESLVFGAFVEKVIVPDSKLREEEVKAYYDEHLGDYSSPEMMRIRSVAFTSRSAAEDAVRKLREGADYGWLVGSAEGQVDKAAPGLLAFDGRPVTTDSLPDEMRKALADAKAQDARLYSSPEGYFYALAVQQVMAPSARPYDEVRAEIAKKLYGEKITRGIEDYATKLRALAKVEVHLRKAE